MKIVHGFAFPDSDQFMIREIQPDGTYQAEHYRACLPYIREWSCAIDGGAHVGCFSRLMAADFRRVIAVEPSPDTFEALRANMTAFGCTNVEPLQIALGATSGFVSMHLDGRGALLHNTGARFADPGGSIPAIPIDDWRLPTLGFLKLDVEGSEVAALEGAAETLQRCRPIVLFENKWLWRRYGLPRDAPQRLLTSLGFKHLADVSLDAIWGPA